jgi:hypothetical protein
LNYKAGQGIEAQFTASFTTGVALSLQFGGLFSLTETLAFGYDGANFSALHSYGGVAEVQEMTVTATGAGTTTVTLDGDIVNITTTAGTVQTVAEEIRAGLAADGTVGAKWRFEQIDDKVCAIAQSVGDKTGTMSVTGASTVSITEATQGALKTDAHVAQASWNRTTTPFAGFDPTKLNVYRIQLGYLGVANIDFFIYNPNAGDYVHVHSIEWANSNNITHVGSPNFKIGWTAASLGSTGTNLTVEGASAELALQGDEVLRNDTHAINGTKGSITTSLVNALTVKNRVVFNNRYGLGKIKPLRLSIDNDHTKGLLVRILKNATIGGTTNYQWADEFNSIAAYDTAGTTVTGGKFLDGFTVPSNGSASISLKDITPEFDPDEYLTIAVQAASGTGATVSVILTWQEDK